MEFMPDDLPFGLYERLITADLKARLLQFRPDAARLSTRAIDPAEASVTLARHIEVVVARALRSLPADQRESAQAAVVNEIIRGLGTTGELLEVPVEQLRAIRPLLVHSATTATSPRRLCRFLIRTCSSTAAARADRTDRDTGTHRRPRHPPLLRQPHRR